MPRQEQGEFGRDGFHEERERRGSLRESFNERRAWISSSLWLVVFVWAEIGRRKRRRKREEINGGGIFEGKIDRERRRVLVLLNLRRRRREGAGFIH